MVVVMGRDGGGCGCEFHAYGPFGDDIVAGFDSGDDFDEVAV